VYFVSLAGDFVGKIDPSSSRVTVLQPPRAGQGTRRIWADSKGILWITGWSSGNLIRLDPKSDDWRFFRLPGAGPSPYAVYVDEADSVWVSDWGSNSILRYDPGLSTFKAFPHSGPRAEVRQIMGRKGELWGAESRRDRIFVIRY
jgi:virginiamycin B lyase